MKLHTSLTADGIRAALARAQESGDIPGDIEFDQFTQGGSRTHRYGYDVHLATERRDTRADGKPRPTAAYYGVRGQLRAASHDEWGAFLAELFSADPAAKAGPYKGRDHFHHRTRHAYAARDEMPAEARDPQWWPEPDDTRTPEPEPEPEYVSTEPVTDAMLPGADRTLARIDDALGCWVNTISPA